MLSKLASARKKELHCHASMGIKSYHKVKISRVGCDAGSAIRQFHQRGPFHLSATFSALRPMT